MKKNYLKKETENVILVTLEKKLAELFFQRTEKSKRYQHYSFDEWRAVFLAILNKKFRFDFSLNLGNLMDLDFNYVFGSIYRIHDFMLIEELLEETTLTEEDITEFYLWYLRKHNQFYSFPREDLFFDMSAYFMIEKESIIEDKEFKDEKRKILKERYKESYNSISKSARKVQDYMSFLTGMSREEFVLQLTLWGISEVRATNIANYLQNQKKEPEFFHKSVMVEKSITLEETKVVPTSKELKIRLAQYYDGKNITGYLNKSSLEEIKEILSHLYRSEVAKNIYQRIYELNEILLKNTLKEYLTDDEFYFLEDVRKDLISDAMQNFQQYLINLKSFLDEVKEFSISLCEEKEEVNKKEYVVMLKSEIEHFRIQRDMIQSIVVGKGNGRVTKLNSNES